MNKLQNLTKGLVKENPVLVLVLGTCPTLATSTSVINALGMGAAACYIVLISGFVTMVQMLVKAFAPALDESLGIYLPLIVVNCIILGRAEMFANKNTVVDSAIDAVGMGAGFTLALTLMATIREVFGNGTFCGLEIPVLVDNKISILTMAPGGFFVFGILIAAVNKFGKHKPKKRDFGCEGCPQAGSCGMAASGCEGAEKAEVSAQ